MKSFGNLTAAIVLAVTALGVAAAQETPAAAPPAPPDHFYRLVFAVEETNDAGTVSNARKYIATIVTEPSQQIFKTGARIPIVPGKAGGDTQMTYVDVGVNFEVRQVKEEGDKLSFKLKAEVSSIPADGPASAEPAPDPVIRQNMWDSTVEIPIGKPTIVFSADDLQDKGRMQVELTATRVE
jgi:hypothetical protein